MNHEAHIRLVDTHTEGDGSHNHVDALHEEIILCGRARSTIQSGMIRSRLDLIGAEHCRQFLHLLSGETIDNTALPRILSDELHDLLINLLRLRSYLIIQVRSVERALELHRIQNTQTLLDIRPHLIRSRSRQGDDRCLTNLVHDRTDTSVFRSEIMSPLRDTVRLVNSIEADLARFQEVHILLLGQRLRSHIQQFGLSCRDVSLHLIDGRLVQRRVQVMRQSILLAHAVDYIHLVLHQGYERRDHDGRALHDQRRQLVAQRFAATGRHQHKCVLTFQYVTDNGFLIAFELIKAEILFQLLSKIHFIAHNDVVSFLCYRLMYSVSLSTLQFLQPSLFQLPLGVFGCYLEGLHLLRWNLEHRLHHHAFHD